MTPIITLKVEGMAHQITAALTEHQAQMDSCIAAAVQRVCTPENIARVVELEAEKVFEQTLQKEVHDFFSYGPGRKVVAAAVKAKLLEEVNQ